MAPCSIASFGLAAVLIGCAAEPRAMVPVEAESVTMGCNVAADALCINDELPYHAISISRFELDEGELLRCARRRQRHGVVADYYDASYYATSPVADPQGPATGTYRAKRGGSFLGDPQVVAFE